MPSAISAADSTADASGSSTASTRSAASTTVTADPNRTNTCASSRPIAPPPSTTKDAGTSSAWIAPRLVQYGVPARPGIGGIDGADPVLTTSAREATYVVPATSTLRGPTTRP